MIRQVAPSGSVTLCCENREVQAQLWQGQFPELFSEIAWSHSMTEPAAGYSAELTGPDWEALWCPTVPIRIVKLLSVT